MFGWWHEIEIATGSMEYIVVFEQSFHFHKVDTLAELRVVCINGEDRVDSSQKTSPIKKIKFNILQGLWRASSLKAFVNGTGPSFIILFTCDFAPFAGEEENGW